jgi:hypothetical protein
MRVYHFPELNPVPQYLMLVSDLMDTKPIHTGEWQAMDTSKSQMHATHELEDVSLRWDQVPEDPTVIIPAIDLEWAREHFAERVSGQPLNPAPSHLRWPYAVRGNADHTTDQQFDHTYPERFWPQHAGHEHDPVPFGSAITQYCGGTPGVRFHYGDLMDVVGLLATKPLTRQAYLPVWFPEDTGATENQRVPCTLGYHFMQREGKLSCRYYIRSCDVYRHLSNDVYFAAMLTRWITDQVYKLTQDNNFRISMRPGSLTMHISSLHAFVGDKDKIRLRFREVGKEEW